MHFTKKINTTLVVWGILSLPIVLIVAFFTIGPLIPDSVHQALPASATDIREERTDSYNGGHLLDLKARMSEKDMVTFAKRLGLERQADGSYLSKPSPGTTYTAKYGHGYLYYYEESDEGAW